MAMFVSVFIIHLEIRITGNPGTKGRLGPTVALKTYYDHPQKVEQRVSFRNAGSELANRH